MRIDALTVLLFGICACGGAQTRRGAEVPAVTQGVAEAGEGRGTGSGSGDASGAGDGRATGDGHAAGTGSGSGDASGTGDGSAGRAAGAGHGASEPSEDRAATDERLIASVRRAVAERVAPEALEAQVGQKPLVNTRTGLPIAVLRRVHLVPDGAHADEALSLSTADSVIYWGRPIDSENPHFVGIQIRKDGSYGLFFAVLMPP